MKKLLRILAALVAVQCFALGLTAATVDLTWRDNSNNETGFRIERATGSGSFVTLVTVAANIVAYTDPTPNAATTYRYRIVAVNSAGSSPFSNIATAVVPAVVVPPAAPSQVTVEVKP